MNEQSRQEGRTDLDGDLFAGELVVPVQPVVRQADFEYARFLHEMNEQSRQEGRTHLQGDIFAGELPGPPCKQISSECAQVFYGENVFTFDTSRYVPGFKAFSSENDLLQTQLQQLRVIAVDQYSILSPPVGLVNEQSNACRILIRYDRKSRHRRIKKQRRYERLAATSQFHSPLVRSHRSTLRSRTPSMYGTESCVLLPSIELEISAVLGVLI
jgi:hypothetical protein